MAVKKRLPGKTLSGIIVREAQKQNPERVFALVESEKGLYCEADDGGETWINISTDPNIRQRAWYSAKIY